MKKIISITIALAMLSASFSAFAVSPTKTLEATAVFDSASNSFTVSGTIDDNKSGDTVTVEAKVDGTPFDVVTVESENGTNGETRKVFKAEIKMDLDSQGGAITFNVTSAHSSNTATAQGGHYYSTSDLYPALKSIKTSLDIADKTASYNSYIGTLNSNDVATKFSFDMTKVPASASAKNVMASYNEGVSLQFNATASDFSNLTDTEKQAVFDAGLVVRKAFSEMTMVGRFASASTQAEFEAVYGDYSDTLKMSNETNGDYFTDNYTATDYFTVLDTETRELHKIDELKDRLVEAAALRKVKNNNASIVKEVFSDFSAFLTPSYSLTTAQQNEVYGKIATKQYANFEALLKAYNDLAKEYNKDVGGGTPPGGGAPPSGGFNNTVIGDVKEETPVTPSVEATGSFSDMELAPWAEVAVKYLYARGIVSGRTETTYAPNDDITRGEFVKLLVCAKGGEETDEIIFPDTIGKWYAGYASAAYRMNITEGFPDGTFRGDEKITREQMAVMIYRMAELETSSEDLSMFSDRDEISKYAIIAVATLYLENIISGMGDGTFSSSSNATRAQAAQMLYNLLNK